MRKIYLLFFLSLIVINTIAQFTPGNIVVSRVGDGATLLNGSANQVQLVEFTAAGAATGTVVTLPVVSGGPGSRACTNSGSATTEGYLTQSYDGRYLVHPGYDAVPGTVTVVASTSYFNRTIARIDATGLVNTSTSFLSSPGNAYSTINLRAVCSYDGTQFWGSGGSGATAGVRYLTFGQDNIAGIQLNSTITNTRGIQIYNDQLYISTAAGSLRIATVGTGLPTSSGQTITNLPPNIPTAAFGAANFIFFDRSSSVTGPDLLYVTCQSTTAGEFGLFKYSFDGTTWTAQGSIQTNAQLFGITGYLDCSGNTVLYTTRATSGSSLPNEIRKFTDNTAYNATIANNGGDFLIVSTLFQSAGANYAFRGLAMSPAQGYSVTGAQAIAAGNYNIITVKSGGTATLTGNIVVYDKIVVESGGILNMAGFTISSPAGVGSSFEAKNGSTIRIGSADGITASAALGNVQTCFRTYNAGANYQYTGTVLQVTGDGLPTTISGSLTINNSAGANLNAVTLSQSTTITTGGLMMNGGNLRLGNNSLISDLVTMNVIPTHANNHIVTDGTGVLTIPLVSTTPIVFPVGPSPDSLSAATINTSTGTNSFSVRVEKGINPTIAFPTYGINRTWFINSTTSVSNVVLGFQYATNDANPGALPQPQLMEILFNNTVNDPLAWNIIVQNLTPVNADPYWLVGGGPITTISNIPYSYAVGINGTLILPIDCVISCRSRKANNNGIIYWEMNSCAEISSFEVQRSVGGRPFVTIGSIRPGTQLDYSYTDVNLDKGTNLYRIKVNRSSGAIKYSNTVAVINDSKGILITALAPNPVSNLSTLVINAAKPTTVHFMIYAISGLPVKQWQQRISEGSNTVTVNTEGLPAGIYQLAATAGEEKTVTRFVKE